MEVLGGEFEDLFARCCLRKFTGGFLERHFLWWNGGV